MSVTNRLRYECACCKSTVDSIITALLFPAGARVKYLGVFAWQHMIVHRSPLHENCDWSRSDEWRSRKICLWMGSKGRPV